MLGALSPLRLLSLNVSDVCTELADNKLVGRMGGGGGEVEGMFLKEIF